MIQKLRSLTCLPPSGADPTNVDRSDSEKSLSGGALSITSLDSASTQIEIRGCNFTANFVEEEIGFYGISAEGGALSIVVDTDASNTVIEGTSFDRNHARGGSILPSVTTPFLSFCPLFASVNSGLPDTDSQARSFGSFCRGGAVSYVGPGFLQILSSSFSRNTCVSGSGGLIREGAEGGAIFAHFKTLFLADQLGSNAGFSIDSSSFAGNSIMTPTVPQAPTFVAAAGGAVSIKYGPGVTSATTAVTSSLFSTNRAVAIERDVALGGAFALTWDGRIQEVDSSFESSRFIENVATGDSDGAFAESTRGGALMMRILSAENLDAPRFRNVTFLKNRAIGSLCRDPRKVSSNCAGPARGGAVSMHRETLVFLNVEKAPGIFDRCHFEGNSAVGGTKGKFQASVDAGAIAWEISQEPIRVFGSTFLRNYVDCILNDEFSDDPEAELSSICRGGAIYSPDGLEAERTNFWNNKIQGLNMEHAKRPIASTAEKAGGAVRVNNFLRLEETHFEGNSISGVLGQGGAVAAVAATVLIVDSQFIHSSISTTIDSASAGGALYLYASDITIQSTLFSHSSIEFLGAVAGRGGALFLAPVSAKEVSNCTFEFVKAKYGGAIFADINGQVPVFANLTITDCLAFGGGGFYFDASPALAESVRQAINESDAWQWSRADASFGVRYATSISKVVPITPPPIILFPGQKFSLAFAFVDLYNQTVIDPRATIELLFNHSATSFQWAPIRSSTPLAASAVAGPIHFPEIEIVVPPATTFSIFTRNFTDVRADIYIAHCPPGYSLLKSKEEFLCERCLRGSYNFNGSHSCEPCPHSEHRIETSSCFAPPLESELNDAESQLQWTIQRGFYPGPSFLEPKHLTPCVHEEACLPYNCTVS